jgi:phospholipid/cholesterol/gamma-HCH transport system substrate-binding protein
METRASYVIVGTFVLLMVAALFAFVIYVAKVQFDEVRYSYHSYFSGSVTGLQEGSAVRYRGVAIGVVSDIRIAPDDASQVRVTFEVSSSTKLTQDSIASIEMQGITGIGYIQIFGGAKGSPPIERKIGEIPVIPSRLSQISEVFDAAPQLLNRLITLSDKAAMFLTEENATRVSGILENTQSLTASASGALSDFSSMAAKSDEFMANLNGAAEQARKIMTENREPIRDFTETGLYDAALLIAEFRELVGNLSRVTAQVQRDPSGFLLAGPRAGVEPSGITAPPSPTQPNKADAP